MLHSCLLGKPCFSSCHFSHINIFTLFLICLENFISFICVIVSHEFNIFEVNHTIENTTSDQCAELECQLVFINKGASHLQKLVQSSSTSIRSGLALK